MSSTRVLPPTTLYDIALLVLTTYIPCLTRFLQEFGGRAAQIRSFVGQTTDGNGHGTHIAGVIGGVIHGVAKRTRLYGVKVLDDNGSGTLAHVIGGMDFIAQDAKTRGCPRGAMANLSIGGAYSRAVNAAAAALVRSGVFVSVAAGGNNGDAGRTSPASEPTVCTVAASTEGDARAPFSDYGPLVDIFAPGTNIKAAWLNGNTVCFDLRGGGRSCLWWLTCE